MEINEDMEYLDENFPKGDKKRGVAMVLLSIARREGKCEVVKEYEEFLDDYKTEQRELVRQEIMEKIEFLDVYECYLEMLDEKGDKEIDQHWSMIFAGKIITKLKEMLKK